MDQLELYLSSKINDWRQRKEWTEAANKALNGIHQRIIDRISQTNIISAGPDGFVIGTANGTVKISSRHYFEESDRVSDFDNSQILKIIQFMFDLAGTDADLPKALESLDMETKAYISLYKNNF